MGRRNNCELCDSPIGEDVPFCCLFGVPKKPPECLWCGEDLNDKRRAFCNKACALEYRRDISFCFTVSSVEELMDRSVGAGGAGNQLGGNLALIKYN